MANQDLNRLKVIGSKDQGTISKWCTNTCQPDLKILVRIAELLQVELT